MPVVNKPGFIVMEYQRRLRNVVKEYSNSYLERFHLL